MVTRRILQVAGADGVEPASPIATRPMPPGADEARVGPEPRMAIPTILPVAEDAAPA